MFMQDSYCKPEMEFYPTHINGFTIITQPDAYHQAFKHITDTYPDLQINVHVAGTGQGVH
jgi:hypothetical protein